MSDTASIVVGIIALACILIFRKELGRLLDRVIGLKVGPKGVELQTTTTPLGQTTVSNPSGSVAALEAVGTRVSYVDPTHSFRLSWPAGGEWIQNDTLAASIGAALFIAYHQAFGNFTPNVNVTVEEIGNASLSTWMDSGNQGLRKLGYTVLETSQDPVTNAGVRVIRNEGVAGTLYQIQRVILSRTRAYIATGSKLEADHAAFPDLYEQMRVILNSFQVL
jgi:hypothetical protein